MSYSPKFEDVVVWQLAEELNRELTKDNPEPLNPEPLNPYRKVTLNL